MTILHELCHRNSALRYVGRVLEHRKLGFRGLKGQFDVKKRNFSGVIAKIGHLRPILASSTHVWPIFTDFAIGIGP